MAFSRPYDNFFDENLDEDDELMDLAVCQSASVLQRLELVKKLRLLGFIFESQASSFPSSE